MHVTRAPQELRTYFVTTATMNRRRLFQVEATAHLMLDILQSYRAEGRFALHAFVIMPDHLHVLLTPSPEVSLEKAGSPSGSKARPAFGSGALTKRRFWTLRNLTHANVTLSRILSKPEWWNLGPITCSPLRIRRQLLIRCRNIFFEGPGAEAAHLPPMNSGA